MRIYELTLYGFNGVTDETDHLILWVKSSKTDINDLCERMDGLISECWPIQFDPDYDTGIDYTLPKQFKECVDYIKNVTKE